MKKDIVVIRESIGRVVSMLTMRKIKVTQRGSQAYVKYHPKTGAIQELNVPYIPDDASDEFIAAIQGFLDHEVGHILFSDFAALKKATAAGKRVANLANLVEDVFVERKMSEAFRGSGANLDSTRKFYLDKIAKPKIDAALKAGNTEEATGYATVVAFRAWGGQTIAADFIKDPKMAALVKPIADKLGPELIAQLQSTKSSMECLKLAGNMLKKLEEAKPKAPPAPPEKGGDTDTDSSPDAGDDSGDDSGDKAEDAGTSRAETDDSGKERGKDDKLDAVDDATDAGESGGKKGGDKDEATDEKEEPDTEGKDPTAESGEPEAGDDPESTGAGESRDDAAGEDSAGEGGASSESDEGTPGDSVDGPAGEDEEAGGDKPTSAPGEPEESGTDPLADMFDTDRDFDKDMSEHLSKEAKSEIESSDYAIFSTEWDKVVPAPLAIRKDSVDKLDGKIKDSIGVMQKQLERAMAAQARKAWNPGQTRGRIAPGSLFKTAVGDDRVFRQRFETRAKNTAVSLLVDCSGSMNGGRIDLAGIAAYALSTVLERLKVNHEVIGFTTTDSREMVTLMNEDSKSHSTTIYGMNWGRIEPLYIPVFKPFGGKLDTQARSRIAHLTERPGWLSQNVDGESVQLAGSRLLKQKAERHVLIVLSDGEPCCQAGRGLGPHLRKVVKTLTTAKVEVIGIGIQTNAVKSYYPKSVVINDAAELPTRVMAELTKLLLAP